MLSSAIGLALAAGSGATAKAADEVDHTVLVEGQRDRYKVERASSPKYTEPLRDTPQSVTVVPDAVIEERRATTLREVLRNVTGISIQAGEGNPPNGDQLKLRGFSVRNDFYVDGVRDVGSYTRDAFNVERVEVVKGPASALAGRTSAGGSINLVTKTPRAESFVNGDFELGTHDRKRAVVDVNQTLDALGLATAAFRLNLMGFESDTPGRNAVESERFGIAPSLAFGLGTPTRLTVAYQHLQQDNVPDYGIPTIREARFAATPFAGKVAPVDFENFYGYSDFDYEDVESNQVTARLEHDFNERVSFRNQFRYGRLEIDSAVSAPRLEPGITAITPATRVRGNRKFRDQTEEIFNNQTDLLLTFATGGIEHSLVTGIEFVWEEAENKRRLDQNGPFVNLFAPTPSIALTGNQLGVYNGTRARLETDTFGVYVADTMKLSEQWFLNGTVRFDEVETRVQGFDDLGVAPGYVTDEERDDSEVSWRAGLVFKPRPNGSIYAGFGSSFEPVASGANTVSGVVQLAGGSNNPPVEAGFDVEPEETTAYELGTKWDLLEERLSVSAAVFRIEKTNARNVDAIDPTIVTVDGEQRVDGFELGFAGAITPEWQVFGGYTFLDSEIVESNLATAREGADIDNTPEHTFTLWTTYRTPYKLVVGGGLQYVDERTNQADVPVTVDDYWLVDAMLSYPLSERLELRLNVYNLLDEEYIDQLGGGQAVPGPSRAGLLSVSFRY